MRVGWQPRLRGAAGAATARRQRCPPVVAASGFDMCHDCIAAAVGSPPGSPIRPLVAPGAPLKPSDGAAQPCGGCAGALRAGAQAAHWCPLAADSCVACSSSSYSGARDCCTSCNVNKVTAKRLLLIRGREIQELERQCRLASNWRRGHCVSPALISCLCQTACAWGWITPLGGFAL